MSAFLPACIYEAMKIDAGKLRKRSVFKGLLAGLAGGLAATAAKAYLDTLNAERENLHLAKGQDMRSRREDVSAEPVPWVFGGLAGAAYGAAVEMEPTAATWQGAAFGLAMNRVAESGVLASAVGGETSIANTTETKISRRVRYAVFGIVAEMVRRGVRRGLA